LVGFFSLLKERTSTLKEVLTAALSIDDDGFEIVDDNQLVGQNTIPQPLKTGYFGFTLFLFILSFLLSRTHSVAN